MQAIIALVFLFVFSSCAFAQTTEERLQELEKTMKKQEQSIQELKALQKTVKKQEQTIEEQRKLIEHLTAKTKPTPPPGAPAAAQAPQTAVAEVQQQVEELKEQVSSVADAQRQKSRASSIQPSGSWGRRSFLIAAKALRLRAATGPAGMTCSSVPWNST